MNRRELLRDLLMSAAAAPILAAMPKLASYMLQPDVDQVWSPMLQIDNGLTSTLVQLHRQPVVGELVHLVYDGKNWIELMPPISKLSTANRD